MINITINGKKIAAEANETILNIAAANGIEIPNLCYDGRMEAYGGCGLCVVEVEGSPKLVRACSAKAADGMVIHTESPRVRECRAVALELLMSDHTGDCKGPCTLNCPAGTDCQAYVKQIALGNYTEAVRIIKEKVPLPASIGRICPHPCETACRRKRVEEPISIALLKAFAADKVLENGGYLPEKAADTGKTVGIVGGGPAGLSAAYYLALAGVRVTVYDAMEKMGGMLRYGIPEYRLPKSILQKEIDEIASLGVEMLNNVKIGRDITLDELREKHNAVLLAIGAWHSKSLRCKGEELDNVWGGIDFLREVALGNEVYIGERTAIVGGGNTAMDACRTAVRLGAKEVNVIYRRTRNEMPAEDIEIEEAGEEGVVFNFLVNPEEILGENGKVCGVKLQKMQLGEPDAKGRRSPVAIEGEFVTMPLDSIIIATGQGNNNMGLEAVETTRWGTLVADEATFKTNLDGVFAIGDATNDGASIAIAAIGEAVEASNVIAKWLQGEEVRVRKPVVSKREPDDAYFEKYEKQARAVMPTVAAEERKHNFGEVNLGFSEEAAREEARRCLECGCHDYGECKLIRYADCYDADGTKFCGVKHKAFTEERLVSIERDQGKCILCNLCVRTCEEIAGEALIGLVGRAFETTIRPEFIGTDAVTVCKNCLKCVEVCPTGALKNLVR